MHLSARTQIKQLSYSVILAIVLIGAAVIWQVEHAPASVSDHFTVSMTDYAFAPAHMVWRVGDRVTITLVNNSQAHPQREHEFMVGRGPNTEDNVFGMHYEDGFHDPFFSGVTIKVESGAGLKMLMPGDAQLTGLPPMKVMAPGPMGPMEEMTGFMPLLGPSSTLTFSFVVPDRPGEWTYGCFQQDGEHFANGMHGTIKIVPQSA